MNRNSESHFANTPTVGISRSKFDRSFDHKTTFNTGDLIPIYCDATIMPGDTVKMNMSEVVRMMTPIAPVMDNANLDIYFFFVPYRLVWEHFPRFMGENDTAPWTQTVEYEIPQINFPDYPGGGGAAAGWHKGDLADYFGYPTEIGYTGGKTPTASVLPFRGYALIWNEFFRDENLQNPVNIEKNVDATVWGKSGKVANYDPVTDTVRGAKPLKAAKYHDYFTSCLPGAQKGPAVQIPLGNSAPVIFGEGQKASGGTWTEATRLIGEQVNAFREGTDANNNNTVLYAHGTNSDDLLGGVSGSASAANEYIGLYTDLSQAVGATVNQLRQAFAIQKFYERQALGGTRYIEMVKAHFDVTNPDYRFQRPEYLGGKRIPINMNQVVQATQVLDDGTGSPTTPLGTTGAYSVTSDRDEMFTHSFTEHGMLIGLACVRTVHTYQQGLNRQYSKKKFTDFYFPEFANLGNMDVKLKEIYMSGVASDDNTAFGYQEAWAAERYFPDIVTGEMRSNYAQSLDIWHYADYYSQAPSLGDTWIQETDVNVGRTLAVQNHDQFFGDFYFKAIYTRPMPLYSIPGLIDHH